MTAQTVWSKSYNGLQQHPKQGKGFECQRRQRRFVKRLRCAHAPDQHRLTLRFTECRKVGTIASHPQQFCHDFSITPGVLANIQSSQIQPEDSRQIKPTLNFCSQRPLTMTLSQTDNQRVDIVFQFMTIAIRPVQSGLRHAGAAGLFQSPFNQADPSSIDLMRCDSGQCFCKLRPPSFSDRQRIGKVVLQSHFIA